MNMLIPLFDRVKLIEVKDSKFMNAPVYSTSGQVIGKIKQVLKDNKTDDIEYAVFASNESNRDSQCDGALFQTKGDKLQLNLKKDELQNAVP